MEQSTSSPLFSILIPTWKRVQPVVQALDSIGQLAADTEVVIVDNGSEPCIFEELQSRVGSRPGVRLFRNEQNLGMVKNWNRCLELARGEWLGLLCSDDCYRPDAIRRLRKVVTAHPDPALIIQDPAVEAGMVVSPAGSETVRDLRLPIASGNFWHRSVYEAIGGFDERFEYSADGEYWYRAAFSFPVVKVREPFAEYLPHDDNYMWQTWRRPDYLQQSELLARTVAGYVNSASPDRDAAIEGYVSMALWGTLLSILESTFLKHGKHDIFNCYFPKALRQAGNPGRAGQLLKALCAAAWRRVQELFKDSRGDVNG